MLRDASTLQETFRDVVREVFIKAEVEVIRTGNEYTASIIQKILRTTLLMTTDLMKEHPHGIRLPSSNEMPNTFIFRFALCSVILVLRWVEGGGQLQTKPERVRNDMVDVNFAAYGTYFDGIMTNDRKMLSIFDEASFVLKEISRR